MNTVPFGYCKCGCGERTNLAKITNNARGWVPGQPRDFIRGHQARVGPSREERFWRYVLKGQPHECWHWTGHCGGPMGYGRFKDHGKPYVAHRMAWELIHGPIPAGLLICHHCDNPPCVNPAHLFLGTQKDNIADRDRKGRAPYKSGEANPASKLTEEAVRDIRQKVASGRSQHSVAKDHNVSPATISSVVRRQGWSHVTDR